MKKISSTIAVFTVFSVLLALTGCNEARQTANAQTDTSATGTSINSAALSPTAANDDSSEQKKNKPSIKFEKKVHDFGVSGPGKYLNCEFKFTNVGDEILKMTRLPHAPCGCTVPKLDKMEYAPGETGGIKVRFHTSTNEGNEVKYLTVFTNDPENPETNLTIKSRTELAIKAEPTRFELNLKDKNGGMPPIVVESKDGSEFSITNFTSSNNAINAKIDPGKKAGKFVIEPMVDMEKLKNQVGGNININTTHPDTKQLLLIYRVIPRFKVTNQRIFLLKPDPDKPEVRDIMVMSNYDEPVEIESISSAKNYIEVLSQEKRNNSVLLKVQVTPPPKTDGMPAFYDMLTVKMKGGEEVKISASGTYPYSRPEYKSDKK